MMREEEVGCLPVLFKPRRGGPVPSSLASLLSQSPCDGRLHLVFGSIKTHSFGGKKFESNY
jgi:hypothetical protein